MSRAFVNEDSAADHANAPIERQVSSQPNYVTAQGHALLQAKVSELQAEHAHETAKGDEADKQRLADLAISISACSAHRWSRPRLRRRRCR